MSNITPNTLAKSTLRQQILCELLKPQKLWRTENRFEHNPAANQDNTVKTVNVPVPGLAANVSTANLDRFVSA